MKWILSFVVVLIFLGVLGGIGAYFYPYYVYYEIVNEGKDFKNEYLNFKVKTNIHVIPQYYSNKLVKGTYDQDESRWEEFNFSNFNIPLPIRHPIYSLIPAIQDLNFGLSLGGKYVDFENSEYFSFNTGNIIPFENILKNDKVFQVSRFRKFINQKSKKSVFNDILNKDLQLKIDKNMALIERVEYLRSIPFEELVYNLHILNLRNQLIPEYASNYSVLKGRNIIVVEKESRNDNNFYEEEIYTYSSEKIYKLKIRTKKEDLLGASAHDRFINKLKFSKSSLDAKDMLYANYRKLPYDRKVAETGMIYLLSSWTHDPKNRGFEKQMIQFLEKGENNLNFLTPLYEYSYMKFNTNFSTIEKRRKESQEEKLKRLIFEEAKEAKRLQDSQVVEPKIEVISKEQMAQQYLEEAKKKANSDEDDSDELIMD